MKKRNIYIVLCILSLCIGGGLYVLFRPNTYVAEFVRGLLTFLSPVFSRLEAVNNDFLKYYFPDFLWAFSLNCGLNAIFNTKKSHLINSVIVFVLSALWEMSQYLGIVSGTGDFIDVAMYFVAVGVILIFEIIHKTKE